MKTARKYDESSCGCTIIHHDTVRKVKERMPADLVLHEMAEFFRIFGDSTRIGILMALAESEMCVCDLTVLLGMQQSAVSHQLRILKQARLVKNRRDGKIMYYSLNDEHIKGILDDGMEHVRESIPGTPISGSIRRTLRR